LNTPTPPLVRHCLVAMLSNTHVSAGFTASNATNGMAAHILYFLYFV